MRLRTRTALAAFAAAFVTLLLTGLVFRGQFVEVLQDRVDEQLHDRAETAPILAAIASRLVTIRAERHRRAVAGAGGR